jgi:hypothetical protein
MISAGRCSSLGRKTLYRPVICSVQRYLSLGLPLSCHLLGLCQLDVAARIIDDLTSGVSGNNEGVVS